MDIKILKNLGLEYSMVKNMRIIYLLAISLLLFGCVEEITPLKELNDNPGDYLGNEITVKGTVKDSLKLGQLSGYTITDGNVSVKVSSQSLPAEGKEVTVTGTWTRDTIFGYYLLAKED